MNDPLLFASIHEYYTSELGIWLYNFKRLVKETKQEK